MSSLAIGLAWGAAVVGLARRWRPAPARVRALPVLITDSDESVIRAASGTVRWPWLDGLRVRLGSWVLRRLGRRPGPDDFAARRLGGALLGAVAALPLTPALPVAAPAAGLVVWGVPGIRRGRDERRRLAAFAADLPDVVDLFVLAVGAGLTVHLAVASVARRGTGPLALELSRAAREASMGRRMADALDDVVGRAGEAVRPLIAALIASERYGASLSAGLERLADEVRRDRRRHAEEAARKVPVKLLFPLVLCTLPAFALLTVAPLIASAVRSLSF